jgi:hypothetical protein
MDQEQALADLKTFAHQIPNINWGSVERALRGFLPNEISHACFSQATPGIESGMIDAMFALPSGSLLGSTVKANGIETFFLPRNQIVAIKTELSEGNTMADFRTSVSHWKFVVPGNLEQNPKLMDFLSFMHSKAGE